MCPDGSAHRSRKDHRIQPIVFGGGQEEGLRSGTENTVGIAALGEAVRTYPKDGPARMAALKRELYDLLRQAIPGCVLNGPEPDSEAAAPHVLNVSLPPVRSQTMLFALEGDGIYVSAGSACAKGHRSHVMEAMNVAPELIDGSIRVSFSHEHTLRDAEAFVLALKESLVQLR